jgi:hypothetical protein
MSGLVLAIAAVVAAVCSPWRCHFLFHDTIFWCASLVGGIDFVLILTTRVKMGDGWSTDVDILRIVILSPE